MPSAPSLCPSSFLLFVAEFPANPPTAAAATPNPPSDPLSLALPAFTKDLHVNTISAFVAAQQAAQAFSSLPAEASKTFIYTGNALNTTIIPPLLDLGVGKSATAHLIHNASQAYREKGYKCVVAFSVVAVFLLSLSHL